MASPRQRDNGGYALLRRTTRLLVNETMATPDNKTTSQRDNEWGGSRLWLRGAALDNKTTSQRDLGCARLQDNGYARLQDNESTRQRVGR